MSFFSEYAVSITVMSVLAVILEMLLPEKNFGKYVSVIIGLVVMMVIISPVSRLICASDTFVLPEAEEKAAVPEQSARQKVAELFAKRLSEKISAEAFNALGVQISCEVQTEVNEKSEITDIKSIRTEPSDEKIKKFISETFGVETEKIGGYDNE